MRGLEGIEGVLFDFDDTLVGTIEPIWNHHRHVARLHYGRELNDEDIRQHWGKPFPELLRLLYETDDVEQALARNRESYLEFPKLLFEWTVPTLKKIKGSGRYTGIVTAVDRVGLESDLSLLRIPREYIDYTQTADETHFHKPDPRVFKPAVVWFAERNIQPGQVLYVGDGLHDMEAALGVGFHFVGVQTGLVTADEFEKAGVPTVPTVAEVLQLVR